MSSGFRAFNEKSDGSVGSDRPSCTLWLITIEYVQYIRCYLFSLLGALQTC